MKKTKSFLSVALIVGMLCSITFAAIDPASYAQGLLDASTLPAAIVDLPWESALPTGSASAYVATDVGNDASGNGTQAAPFKTLAKALSIATAFHAKNPATQFGVYLACDAPICLETFGGRNVAYLTFAAWRKTSVEDYALMGGSGAVLFLTSQHLRLIDIGAHPAAGVNPALCNYGFYFNGCSDVQIDYCDVDGYGNDFACVSTSPGFLLQRSNFSNARLPTNLANPQASRAQGIFTQGVDATCIVRGCTLYHDGFAAGSIAMTQPATWGQFAYSHGWYHNADVPTAPDTDAQNLYWLNATTGSQQRMGGTISWDVFAYDGNACDAFGGGASWSVTDCAILGFPPGYSPANFPGWGQGLLGSAPLIDIERLIIDDTCTAYLPTTPPVITLQPAAGTAATRPGSWTATINTVQGVWPGTKPVVQATAAYAVTQSNVSVRQPKPGELGLTIVQYVASLNPTLSITTEDQAYAWVHTHKRDRRATAPAIILWVRAQWNQTH